MCFPDIINGLNHACLLRLCEACATAKALANAVGEARPARQGYARFMDFTDFIFIC